MASVPPTVERLRVETGNYHGMLRIPRRLSGANLEASNDDNLYPRQAVRLSTFAEFDALGSLAVAIPIAWFARLSPIDIAQEEKTQPCRVP